MPDQYVLSLSCPNKPGIVASVSRHLYEHGADIREAHQFDDEETGRFFMRVRFNFVEAGTDSEALRSAFDAVAQRHDMDWSLNCAARRQKVLILVSRFDHCLADLLYRWRIGELSMDCLLYTSPSPRD